MKQLSLRVSRRITLPPPEQLPCKYCDRRGHSRIGDEVRCWMHLQGPEARLPARVRREAQSR